MNDADLKRPHTVWSQLHGTPEEANYDDNVKVSVCPGGRAGEEGAA